MDYISCHYDLEFSFVMFILRSLVVSERRQTYSAARYDHIHYTKDTANKIGFSHKLSTVLQVKL